MNLFEPQKRTCEGCTLCCKLVPVEELHKPANKWCNHILSRRSPFGCMIYPDRPQGCKDFECLWLNTSLSVEMHPRSIHAVLHSPASSNKINIYCDPDYELETSPIWNWVAEAKKIYEIEIFYGKRHFVIAKNDGTPVESNM